MHSPEEQNCQLRVQPHGLRTYLQDNMGKDEELQEHQYDVLSQAKQQVNVAEELGDQEEAPPPGIQALRALRQCLAFMGQPGAHPTTAGADAGMFYRARLDRCH